MIDYEKLKLAHELADKLNLYSYEIKLRTYKGVTQLICFNYRHEDSLWVDSEFNSIDDLIAKLQELTQPESKYKVGETIWYVNSRQIPLSMKIQYIDFEKDKEPFYVEEKYHLPQSAAYSSLEELIESQLVYWSSLMAKEELNHKQSSCSESIRKHHELEDEEKKGRDKAKELINSLCKSGKHERDPKYQGGCWEEIDHHHRCIKCGMFYI